MTRPDDRRGSLRGSVIVLAFLFLFSLCSLQPAAAQDSGVAPEDIWSSDYANWVYPWSTSPGADADRVQFKAYHDYFTMRSRMQSLAEQNPDFITFHEGMPGGLNARGDQMTLDDYEGWFYGHPSPWVKITKDPDGGECNAFVGDCGNYEDRPDVMLVGNHHAREWMSYEVPMFFLETVAHYYGTMAIDNDGDGRIDEDPWGDADGDGQIDDDGDCLSLNASFQDSNEDGIACGPGDLGVDEDFSEEEITRLVDTREIYLIPMLNVDGNRYDREVFCGEDGWNCDRAGWRKNLRENMPDPFPLEPGVNEDCDGVDLNRNYQFEWGWPTQGTVPGIPGTCTSQGGLEGTGNDVYTGPVEFIDDDDDGFIDEDPVDGSDNDADGLVDEDPAGGNSEPETKFIQDMTEMNDDNGDGASEFKATLTWHSYSNLVLYPWGHCTNCETDDHAQLIFHGDVMAEMTLYENMQSSGLYPTTGDFCDWHYGVHDSYCYTIEIGGPQDGFHPHPDKIDHIAVRNLGIPFYMIEISDDPRQRADLGIANITPLQHLQAPDDVVIPEKGSIPIEFCLDQRFPISFDVNRTYLRWRFVKPSSSQSDYGPAEWRSEPWQNSPFEAVQAENGSAIPCELEDGSSNGIMLHSDIDVADDIIGQIHYSAYMSTLGGATTFYYPDDTSYFVVNLPYRAGFGSGFVAFFMFLLIAAAVWGGLALCIREMIGSGDAIGLDDVSQIVNDDEDAFEQSRSNDSLMSEEDVVEEPSEGQSVVPLKYSERTLNKIAAEHDLDPDRLLTYAWAYDLDKNGYLNATELTAAAKALVGRRGDADIDAAIDAAGEDL